MEDDASDDTVFARYGGLPGVVRIVVGFYDRLLDVPELRRHFDGVDMPRLIDHQTQFIAYAMDAPVEFDEARLGAAHAGLGIGHAEYDLALRLLDATLVEHGVALGDRALLLGRIERCRPLVVTG